MTILDNPIIQTTFVADSDIESIFDYLAQRNLDAARHVVRDIGDNIEKLGHFPTIGPARPELADGLRFFPVGNHLVFYIEIPGGIIVQRVLHSSLDIVPEMFW
jgi:toxin ParE1/3/4